VGRRGRGVDGSSTRSISLRRALLALVTLSNPRLIAEPVGGGVASTALTAARYLSRYLSLVLLPVQQSIDYSFDAIPPSGGLIRPWTTLPSVLLVLGLTAAAAGALWRCARRRCESAPRPHDAPGERANIAPLAPVLAFGWFWFFGTLAPVLQFVPIPERFAERFAYLPALGVVLVAAWAATRLVRFEAVLGWGAAGALCALLAAATVHRNAQWKSPLLLWTSAVEAQPRAARAHLGRANALKEIGRLREAEVEYGNAISIFEEKPELPLHHGFILQAVALRGAIRGVLAADEPGRVEGAIEDYRRVIAATDTDGVVIESLASARSAALRPRGPPREERRRGRGGAGVPARPGGRERLVLCAARLSTGSPKLRSRMESPRKPATSCARRMRACPRATPRGPPSPWSSRTSRSSSAISTLRSTRCAER
jgi:tetratricopeptide (TPR) repeat protein